MKTIYFEFRKRVDQFDAFCLMASGILILCLLPEEETDLHTGFIVSGVALIVVSFVPAINSFHKSNILSESNLLSHKKHHFLFLVYVNHLWWIGQTQEAEDGRDKPFASWGSCKVGNSIQMREATSRLDLGNRAKILRNVNSSHWLPVCLLRLFIVRKRIVRTNQRVNQDDLINESWDLVSFLDGNHICDTSVQFSKVFLPLPSI